MTSFEIVGERSIASGRFLALECVVVRAPDGELLDHDVIRHPGGVAVLPVEAGQVWFISQYRSAMDSVMLEIPAGKRDGTDEDPLEGARRELQEELGATATDWTHLASMAPSPGYTDEVVEIFAASGLTFGDRQPDGVPEQHASVLAMPIAEALDSIASGRITDGKTLIALLEWTRRHL